MSNSKKRITILITVFSILVILIGLFLYFKKLQRIYIYTELTSSVVSQRNSEIEQFFTPSSMTISKENAINMVEHISYNNLEVQYEYELVFIKFKNQYTNINVSNTNEKEIVLNKISNYNKDTIDFELEYNDKTGLIRVIVLDIE